MRGTRLAIAIIFSAVLVAVSACGAGTAGHPAADPGRPRLSHADYHWIYVAHQANMAEIQAGRLGQLDGGSSAIRSAGATMLRDHEALDSELIKVANAMKLRLPQTLTVQQADTIDRLSQESGVQFDHDFTASMMTAHQTMITATRYEIAHGSSPAVVTLARKALPVLFKHLKMLQAAAATG